MNTGMNVDLSTRHESTQHIMRLFDSGHLPEDLQVVALASEYFAFHILEQLPDGPELTTGLRKLLEAKDCFVRQAVIKRKEVD